MTRKNQKRTVAGFIVVILAVCLPIISQCKGKAGHTHNEQSALATQEQHLHGGASAEQKKVLYHCPMHTQYITDHPGKCPICGMDLVKIEEEPEQQGGTAETSMPNMPAGFGAVNLSQENRGG
jgi:hypothetical protein